MGDRGGSTAAEQVTLRTCTAYDEPFLLRVYASTREAELALMPWSEQEKAAFVQAQYDAQRRHYAAAFPNAEHAVVEVGGRPAGRSYVDRSDAEIRIVDLSLLPAFRGRGVGAVLIERLLGEAATTGRPVRLRVADGNPARRLYLRLGFAPVERSGGYELMERLP